MVMGLVNVYDTNVSTTGMQAPSPQCSSIGAHRSCPEEMRCRQHSCRPMVTQWKPYISSTAWLEVLFLGGASFASGRK
eukprot:2536831-Amphidinium_carterae.2